jgi:hypothetical protein
MQHGANAAHRADLTRLAVSATNHCLTGCATGEVIGMVIAISLGWSDVRECWSFAQWDLMQRGRIRLDVTAGGDAVAAVRAMFEEPPPTGNPARSEPQLEEISR